MKQYSEKQVGFILLIGGTDPSGAGLQTDWKVANALQVQASSVVTAVTSQHANAVIKDGVLSYVHIKSQLDCLKDQSFSAIKIGMLGNDQAVKAVLEYIQGVDKQTALIVDPVLSASSGDTLLTDKGIDLLLSNLLPLATLITPNTEELATLTGLPINTLTDVEAGAQNLIDRGAKSVLVKGGHLKTESTVKNKSIDVFVSTSETFYLVGERWNNRKNVRGTGCVFASAVASAISKGYNLNDSLVFAKAMISRGIREALKVEGQHQFQFSSFENHPFSLQDLPTLVHSSDDVNLAFNFPDCGGNRLGIYPVVDSLEWIKKLVPLGIETIQLRIKDKHPEEVEEDILSAINFCKDYNARLFINDYWQLAVKHQAYGIHLGQEDLTNLTNDDLKAIQNAGCRLGVSTHSYAEVARAHHIKPSYLALGPIFATTSKDMPWIPQGVEAVQSWVELLGDDYPLVAIGGINLERAGQLKQVGVGSVAMISAITHVDDYAKATDELVSLWSENS